MPLANVIRLGICKGQLSISLGFPQVLAGHLEALDQLIVFACTVGDLDDFSKIEGILSLDIRFYMQNK
jgi:hypothetical protein